LSAAKRKGLHAVKIMHGLPTEKYYTKIEKKRKY